jgi:hypothetical protein
MSGRPMLEMYSFLSRTSLMVNEITSRPIFAVSAAQLARSSDRSRISEMVESFRQQLADQEAQVETLKSALHKLEQNSSSRGQKRDLCLTAPACPCFDQSDRSARWH